MICTVVPFGSFTGSDAVFFGMFTVTSFPVCLEEREEPEEPEEEPDEPDEEPDEPEEDPDEPDEPEEDPDEPDDLLDCAAASGSARAPDNATDAAAASEMACVRAVKRITTRFTNTLIFPTVKQVNRSKPNLSLQ